MKTSHKLREEPKAYGAALPKPHFKTARGAAYRGKAEELLPAVPDESVSLIFTSPPYALHFPKACHGNVDQDKYVDWLLGFASEFKHVLKPDGSLVINIGGSWRPGHPVRALCHFEVLIRLVREHGFHLAQEFFWHNPAKLPAPAGMGQPCTVFTSKTPSKRSGGYPNPLSRRRITGRSSRSIPQT